MYLPLLDDEHKKLFLELAFHMVMADGVFCDEEREMMNCYYAEMKCEPLNEKEIREINVVIQDMKIKMGEREKKIVVFEMLGLALSDDDYAVQEQEIIKKLIGNFGISQEFPDECQSLINEYLSIQKRLNKLIL